MEKRDKFMEKDRERGKQRERIKFDEFQEVITTLKKLNENVSKIIIRLRR